MRFITTVSMVIALLACQSCCAPGSTSSWCKIEAKLVDCATIEGQTAVANLAVEIEAVMAAVAGDWAGVLAQLEAQSASLVACALSKVMATTKSPLVLARATVYLDGLRTRRNIMVKK
jgi:hypothetical protein